METSGGWQERYASRIFGRRQWQDLKQRIPGRSTICFGRYFRLLKILLCIPECEFLLWRVNFNSNQCIAGCRPLSRCPLCMGTMYRPWMTLLSWFTSELQMRGLDGFCRVPHLLIRFLPFVTSHPGFLVPGSTGLEKSWKFWLRKCKTHRWTTWRREWYVYTQHWYTSTHDTQLEGNATPCLVSRVLEGSPSEEMENSVKCVAGTVYGGKFRAQPLVLVRSDCQTLVTFSCLWHS